MEISEREYYELKEQIRQLQCKVEGISTPPKDLHSRVEEHPIVYVRNVEEDVPVFDYSSRVIGDAWTLFVRLAKIIHKPSDKFYMGTTYGNGRCDKPYIRSYRTGEAPRKITEMSEEQIQISVDMLNELIPIYNKYFRRTHQTVLYSDENNGIYRAINVFQMEEG
ncbi:MAG: hypothetical protein IJZ23_12625 [Roseburia sp.]|nr:hypothetical protein [Roseburia sp.]